ncbi:MAG: hypothetical protein KDA45_16580, partial [Planctomycetales bacterium]|nr:hypothetical protein [Planctomycetales bacterium]
YDVVALEISDPRVTLTQLQHAPVEATLRNIADQLAELEELVSQAADPTQQKLLANLDGDFERWDDNGAPVGWSVSSLPQVHIGRSIDLPHSGKFSLLIENRSKSSAAWIQSRPVAPPRTGRLAVQAWLRAPAVSEPLLVRLSLIGRTRTGQRFERSALLGGRNDSSAPIAIDWGRKPLTLYVGDIPTEETVELVVSIELIGPGKVWVDDVQIFESLLQPDERNHLRGQLLVANQKLAESNAYPAEKLLDSHWGQYLLRYGPLMKPEGKVAQGAPAAVATPSRPVGPQSSWSESPSVLRQLRESLRDRWRR